MAELPGFLVLARKLFASDLWNRAEPFDSRSAFIDLLRRASYSPRPFRTQGREIHLEPGELVLNAVDLARRWGWSKSKVTRFLRELRHRGTLSMRPAWDQKTASKRVPQVYSFPNYVKHQRPWDVTQERDAGNMPATVDDTPTPRPRSVTQDNIRHAKYDPGTRRRKQPRKHYNLSDPVTQDGDPGLTKSDPGNTPAVIDDPPTREPGTESNLSKESSIPYLSYQPDDPEKPDTYSAVQQLAAFSDATAWGNGTNPHRGINIQTLLRLIQAGTNPETIAHIIRGTRLLADAGRIPWIQPGEGFCLTAIWPADPSQPRHLEDRSLSSAAFEASTTDTTEKT